MSEIGPDERGLVRSVTVLENAEYLASVSCGERLMLLVTRGHRDGALWYQLTQLKHTDTGWTYAGRAVYLPVAMAPALTAILRRAEGA